MEASPFLEEDFKIHDTIGRGSFSCVSVATHVPSGRCCALKIQGKEPLIRHRRTDKIFTELGALQAAGHPFVVEFRGAFQDSRCIYFMLEYVPGGELFDHLRRAGCFSLERARFYGAQVVSALIHLHSIGMLYRNLKPEEVILDSLGYLRLVDFGFAKDLTGCTTSDTLCGTPEYLAPEVVLNKGHGKPADWWSFGVFVYEMLVGRCPFVESDAMKIYQKILDGKVPFPVSMDADVKHMLKSILRADDRKRLQGAQVPKASWFRSMDWDALVAKRIPAEFVPEVAHDADTSNFEALPEWDATQFEIPHSDPFAGRL